VICSAAKGACGHRRFCPMMGKQKGGGPETSANFFVKKAFKKLHMCTFLITRNNDKAFVLLTLHLLEYLT